MCAVRLIDMRPSDDTTADAGARVVAWTSDLHLGFLAEPGQDPSARLLAWLAALAREPFDALLISGDISEAPRLLQHLALLESAVKRPLYFVLGNHDFYRSSLTAVMTALRESIVRSTDLHCLELLDFVTLNAATALVGHGCWGDGRYGDFAHSRIVLNDWKVIQELRHWKRGPWAQNDLDLGATNDLVAASVRTSMDDVDRPSLAAVLRRLGEQAAAHIERVLPLALEARRRVLLLTHTPPFVPRDVPTRVDWEHWAPFAGCKAAADVIQRIMADYPRHRLLILAGHVHVSSCIQVAPNIAQRTAAAQYGAPRIEELIELPVE